MSKNNFFRTKEILKAIYVKKIIIIFFFCNVSLFNSKTITAQVIDNTDSSITYEFANSAADSLLQLGNVKEAINFYRQSLTNNNKIEQYNFSCALALDGQADTAFNYLFPLINYFTFTVLIDPNFLHLHPDPRWIILEDSIYKIVQEESKYKFKKINLSKMLCRMYAKDQAYFPEIELSEERIGYNSSVVIALWDLKRILNHQNLDDLKDIILKEGWPKISEVGELAANSAFLIVQHSDLKTQKKYLSTIKQLCEKGEAKWSNYALLYDRIQVQEQKKQLYGTQFYIDQNQNKFLYPLINQGNVNELRKQVGLDSISDFLIRNGIIHQNEINKSK